MTGISYQTACHNGCLIQNKVPSPVPISGRSPGYWDTAGGNEEFSRLRLSLELGVKVLNSARISAMTRSTLQPGLNVGDAQDLLNLWGDLPSPRAILTSPPYLDTHDYGNASRIGAQGQDLDEYLVQMLKLFRCCYRIASADATLWLVAGAIRRNKRLIPLPDRLASCAEEAGWKLRESITWDKQKALPWTHHGEMRDITEQVLLFSKEEDFRFDPTELRSPLPNSVWWRRYPERYSPDGAMPTNLWSIPIPTQGSWSGTRTHFCPARPGLDAIDCKVYDG